MTKQDYLQFLQKKKQINEEERLMNKYIKECGQKYIIYYFPQTKVPETFFKSLFIYHLKKQSITIYIPGNLSKNLYTLLIQNNMYPTFKMHTKYLNAEELEKLKQERKLELL